MLELNRRGHNLTVITPDPIRDSSLKNYKEIDVSFMYELWNRKMIASPKDFKIIDEFPEIFIFLFAKLGPEICEGYLSSPEIQKLLLEKPEFDILITEFGSHPCVYGFSKFTSYKHIGMTSFQTIPVVHSNIGNLATPSYIPDPFFSITDSMNFVQRLRSTIFHLFMWFVYGYTMWSQNKITKKYFGNDLPHLIDLERNLTLLMVNTHFSMSYPRPYPVNLIEIGGPPFHLNGRKRKSLPKVNFSFVFIRMTIRWKKITKKSPLNRFQFNITQQTD